MKALKGTHLELSSPDPAKAHDFPVLPYHMQLIGVYVGRVGHTSRLA